MSAEAKTQHQAPPLRQTADARNPPAGQHVTRQSQSAPSAACQPEEARRVAALSRPSDGTAQEVNSGADPKVEAASDLRTVTSPWGRIDGAGGAQRLPLSRGATTSFASSEFCFLSDQSTRCNTPQLSGPVNPFPSAKTACSHGSYVNDMSGPPLPSPLPVGPSPPIQRAPEPDKRPLDHVTT
ncbi:hypothetical protein V494_03098 [Pseudogymnoascus sp. VKM F-4513 (FW-928)]|nr:hypothetical protein V494_03098 [Pseudogymnoascus sp. VKM F-4513 (FW-928)]